MGKYEQYYGAQKSSMLFKEELVAQSPDELKPIRDSGQEAEPLLRYVDTWEKVPKEVLENASTRGELENALSLARSRADSYVASLAGMKDVDSARRQIGPLGNSREQLRSHCKTLHRWDHIVLPFTLRDDLKDATRFVELVATINQTLAAVEERADQIKETVTKGVDKTVSMAREATEVCFKEMRSAVSGVEAAIIKLLSDTEDKFKGELAKAGEFSQRIKKTFEDSEVFVQNKAMTAFGNAFDQETTLADKNARRAGAWSIVSLVLLGVILGVFVCLEILGIIRYEKAGEVAHWSFVRLSAVGILIWLAGHFFRERGNFLHVAVANRHRRNLCNAYIAVAEKMTEEGRAQYLSSILPQLSRLGKTGFITKEEIPDTPVGQLARTMTDSLSKGQSSV